MIFLIKFFDLVFTQHEQLKRSRTRHLINACNPTTLTNLLQESPTRVSIPSNPHRGLLVAWTLPSSVSLLPYPRSRNASGDLKQRLPMAMHDLRMAPGRTGGLNPCTMSCYPLNRRGLCLNVSFSFFPRFYSLQSSSLPRADDIRNLKTSAPKKLLSHEY